FKEPNIDDGNYITRNRKDLEYHQEEHCHVKANTCFTDTARVIYQKVEYYVFHSTTPLSCNFVLEYSCCLEHVSSLGGEPIVASFNSKPRLAKHFNGINWLMLIFVTIWATVAILLGRVLNIV